MLVNISIWLLHKKTKRNVSKNGRIEQLETITLYEKSTKFWLFEENMTILLNKIDMAEKKFFILKEQ